MEKIEKQLRKLPLDDRNAILDAMEQIILRNFPSLDRKRLKGFKNIYRVRVGSYRIIYFDDGNEIIFESVRRRNEKTYRGL